MSNVPSTSIKIPPSDELEPSIVGSYESSPLIPFEEFEDVPSTSIEIAPVDEIEPSIVGSCRSSPLIPFEGFEDVPSASIQSPPADEREPLIDGSCRSSPLIPFEEFEYTNDGGTQSSNFYRIIRLVILMTLYLVFGIVIFYFLDDQIKGEKKYGIVDVVYFTIVTMTSVGYGDLVPSSTLSKICACAYVLSGFVVVILIVQEIADYVVEKQQILLTRTIHMLGHHRIMDEINRTMEANKARFKCILTSTVVVVMFIVGTVVLCRVEKLDFVDALYVACSTITTLGYGDISFSTKNGRIFAAFWILVSSICLAQLFGFIAELRSEKKQKEFVKHVISKRMKVADVKKADVDKKGSVSYAEYVLFKLKDMGKTSDDEIAELRKAFDNLPEVHHSGTLFTMDLQ